MKIRNWSRWQSYRRDRGQPPWIKVHRRLLNNCQWAVLSDAQKGQLLQMWILAADKDGELPDDPKLIQKLCMLDEMPDLDFFQKHGFIEEWRQADVTLTSYCRHIDAPETETETDKPSSPSTEKRASAHPRKFADVPPCPYEWIRDQYNSLAGRIGLPKCQGLSDARKRAIKARWREYPNQESWENFFLYVEDQPFLAGKNGRGWVANIDWLMNASNFVKVIEEQYNRDHST